MIRQTMPDEAQTILQARLREAVSRAGGVPKFSQISGVPKDTLNKYLSGSQPGPAALVKIADAAEWSLDYLLGRSADGNVILPLTAGSIPADDPSEFIRIPRFDVKASAGRGRIALAPDLMPQTEIAFRTAWLRSLGVMPEHAEFLTAEGDSMLETIQDGDLLLINRLIDQVVTNAIYVVVLAGQVMVKRLQLLFDGSIMLISDNPRYQPERVDKAEVEGLQVEGRVRWYGRAV